MSHLSSIHSLVIRFIVTLAECNQPVLYMAIYRHQNQAQNLLFWIIDQYFLKLPNVHILDLRKSLQSWVAHSLQAATKAVYYGQVSVVAYCSSTTM